MYPGAPLYGKYVGKTGEDHGNVSAGFTDENGNLNVEKVIQSFQRFMKEQHSSKDKDFIERNGRLLFLAFIKPIIK
jgi:hypothetical protein